MTEPTVVARERLTEALVATGRADRDAFRQVYALTSAKLFGICLRICGEQSAAEDVLHDVFLLIWRRAAAFDPRRGHPIAWLAAVARNRAIDWRRAEGRRSAAPLAMADEVVDPEPLPGDALAASDEAARLLACLAALEERQRAAIRTAFFEGVTYADLAARDGVPLGTMKSWMRRGLIALRRCVEP